MPAIIREPYWPLHSLAKRFSGLAVASVRLSHAHFDMKRELLRLGPVVKHGSSLNELCFASIRQKRCQRLLEASEIAGGMISFRALDSPDTIAPPTRKL